MAWGKPQALEEEEKGGGCVTKVINAAIGQRKVGMCKLKLELAIYRHGFIFR